MRNVYLVQHCYEYNVTDEIKEENVKIIGIYSSRKKAEEVVKKYKEIKGFSRFPDDCFYIDKYKLNQDYWRDGFITYDGSTGEWIE